MTISITYLHGQTPDVTVDGQRVVGMLPFGSFAVPGSDMEVLFNDGGITGASENFKYDKDNKTLTIGPVTLLALTGIGVTSGELRVTQAANRFVDVTMAAGTASTYPTLTVSIQESVSDPVFTLTISADGSIIWSGNYLEVDGNEVLNDGNHNSTGDPHTQYALESALGTMSTQNKTAVDIEGGTIDGTPIGNTSRSTVKATTINANDSILSTGPTNGIGYAVGAGGNVTQGSGSGKATAITINKVSGYVTMDAAALNAGVSVNFVFNNSCIAADDGLLLTLRSNGSLGEYNIWVSSIGTGVANCTLKNVGPNNRSQAVIFNFHVIKGASS